MDGGRGFMDLGLDAGEQVGPVSLAQLVVAVADRDIDGVCAVFHVLSLSLLWCAGLRLAGKHSRSPRGLGEVLNWPWAVHWAALDHPPAVRRPGRGPAVIVVEHGTNAALGSGLTTAGLWPHRVFAHRSPIPGSVSGSFTTPVTCGPGRFPRWLRWSRCSPATAPSHTFRCALCRVPSQSW